MGEVYLAEDTRLNRKIAVKVLTEDIASDKDRLRRFEQEARAASALNHPNILTVFEFGFEKNVHFLATEFVEGETLRERISGGGLSISDALNIGEQTAFALSAAHAARIVHRDIKPENIMIRRDGIVKVLDFGLAKLTEKREANLDAEAETRALVKTNPGVVMGTVSYMSPEQARGKETDARTDIWSLGVVLYEMLTGHLPFAGETMNDSIAAILTKEPPLLAQYVSDVPAELQRIARKALTKDRDERYQTARDLMIDFKTLRRELDLRDEIERSTTPHASDARMVSTGENAATQTFAAENTAQTANNIVSTKEMAQTTSSAEYVATEIKRHKLGFGIGLIVLLLASIGLGYWFFNKRSANIKQIESIAVMPFVNESGNADIEYLSDGMTESLITSLSQLPKLNVKARSSVFRYKGKETDAQTIGKELNVQAILTGRVVQRGNDLTLYIELIDAATENVLWKDGYTRPMSNLVLLQSDIAKDVSNQLKIKLSGAVEEQVTKTYTENTEAYQFYLKGLYHWNKRTGDDLKQAIALFQQAIDKDPSYAKAYAGIALTYGILAKNTVMTREEADETLLKAKAAARKGLELDNTLAEAYAVLADVKSYEWDFAGAENDFKRAIELNPNYATARQWYSELLARLARHDEALTEVKKAYELDPFSRAVRGNVGLRYLEARRYDEAIAELKKLIEAEPTYPVAYMFLGGAYEDKGMFEEALEARCKGDVLLKINTPETCERENEAIREAIKKDGATGYWRKVLERLLKEHEQGTTPAASVAAAYARLGEREKAFEWLEKAFAKRDPKLSYLKTNESFDNIKSDPRFQDLLRRIGLPQ